MLKKVNITAIVLTRNESIHLARCLKSLLGIVDAILVVDSYSTDDTVSIANHFGCIVVQRKWKNYSDQFNWALKYIGESSDWILRIDADEVLDENLQNYIVNELPKMHGDICGIFCRRRIKFLGKVIKHGGFSRINVLRIFRNGHGECETRWMDEHIRVDGNKTSVDGVITDENLNSLTWWIEKHNWYASREAIDLLNIKYKFLPTKSVASLGASGSIGRTRWIKERIYSNLPIGFRAFLYFLYRYIFLFGFFDGGKGFYFHFLQGYWYRFLVDMKVREAEELIRSSSRPPKLAIKELFGIEL